MKSIKMSIALILVFSLVFCFCGCGKNETDNSSTETSSEYYNSDTYYYNETVNNDLTQSVIISQEPTQASTQPITQPVATQQETISTTVATQAPVQQQPTSGVGKYTATYKGVEQAVFYPNSLLSDSKTYPVISWANGTGFSYTIYESLIKEIAEGGYIVVANTETMAADGTAQISSLDFIISENNNSSSVLYNKVNTEKLGVAGHSQGGRSAVNAAAKDSRIDCVFSLAGSNFIEEAELLSTPALFFAGAKDMIVGAEKWVKPAYNASKGVAVYANLKSGIHITCTQNPEIYSGYAISWFDAWLKNDNSAKSVFKDGGDLSNDSSWTDFQCKGL